MRTVISRGQWQPQAAVSPLLGPTSAAKPLVNEQGKPASQKPLRDECKAVCQAPAPHGTCGSCWLGTAQQFYHDMRGEGGSRVTSKLKQGAHIHQPTAWPLPHACAQPYHAGSGSHGQLFRPYRGSSEWHSRQSLTGENPCIKHPFLPRQVL